MDEPGITSFKLLSAFNAPVCSISISAAHHCYKSKATEYSNTPGLLLCIDDAHCIVLCKKISHQPAIN